jgi:hypothetical protein
LGIHIFSCCIRDQFVNFLVLLHRSQSLTASGSLQKTGARLTISIWALRESPCLAVETLTSLASERLGGNAVQFLAAWRAACWR